MSRVSIEMQSLALRVESLADKRRLQRAPRARPRDPSGARSGRAGAQPPTPRAPLEPGAAHRRRRRARAGDAASTDGSSAGSRRRRRRRRGRRGTRSWRRDGGREPRSRRRRLTRPRDDDDGPRTVPRATPATAPDTEQVTDAGADRRAGRRHPSRTCTNRRDLQRLHRQASRTRDRSRGAVAGAGRKPAEAPRAPDVTPPGAQPEPTREARVVVQRYGADINGGAELHARYIAEHLAAHADVRVLTTCARDYVTWRNEFPAGADDVNGIPVERFAVVARARHLRLRAGARRRSSTRRTRCTTSCDWLDSEGPGQPGAASRGCARAARRVRLRPALQRALPPRLPRRARGRRPRPSSCRRPSATRRWASRSSSRSSAACAPSCTTRSRSAR